jgi:predicted secreted acid phosphatase
MSGCTAEITNLTHAKKEVQDYYESGKYDAEMNSIANDALKALEKMQIDKTTSVVIDIDECALANYPQIKLVGFGYVTKIWDDWIYSAKAKAIPQTKKIYDYLVSKGAKIIFLTGRNDKYYDATRKNLIDEKYSKIDTLICRSDKESKLSAVQHKSHYREELTKKGWKIIANIGDQWSDFEGGNSGYIIKLPNYLYFTK